MMTYVLLPGQCIIPREVFDSVVVADVVEKIMSCYI